MNSNKARALLLLLFASQLNAAEPLSTAATVCVSTYVTAAVCTARLYAHYPLRTNNSANYKTDLRRLLKAHIPKTCWSRQFADPHCNPVMAGFIAYDQMHTDRDCRRCTNPHNAPKLIACICGSCICPAVCCGNCIFPNSTRYYTGTVSFNVLQDYDDPHILKNGPQEQKMK